MLEHRAVKEHVGALDSAGRQQSLRRDEIERLDRNIGNARVVIRVVKNDGTGAVTNVLRAVVGRRRRGGEFEEIPEKIVLDV
ncbi:MAG TPA: hypothetical protein VMI47_14310, partial [Pseudolabrys sp.]|nr:hypothetical protein [Pseudolabrys sp.]